MSSLLSSLHLSSLLFRTRTTVTPLLGHPAGGRHRSAEAPLDWNGGDASTVMTSTATSGINLKGIMRIMCVMCVGAGWDLYSFPGAPSTTSAMVPVRRDEMSKRTRYLYVCIFSPGGMVSEGEAWTLCRPGIRGLGSGVALPEEESEASGGRERGETIVHSSSCNPISENQKSFGLVHKSGNPGGATSRSRRK